MLVFHWLWSVQLWFDQDSLALSCLQVCQENTHQVSSEVCIPYFSPVSLLSQCGTSVSRKWGSSDRAVLSELSLRLSWPPPFLSTCKPVCREIVLGSCPGLMSNPVLCSSWMYIFFLCINPNDTCWNPIFQQLFSTETFFKFSDSNSATSTSAQSPGDSIPRARSQGSIWGHAF